MALRTNLRVLVVDDMSISRQILTQMLDRLGVRRVDTARTGQEALEKLARAHADLVIADLNMPGMDGIDLLASLRRSDRTAPVHFVLTSGDDASSRIAEGRRLGLDATLFKPFDIDAVLECVEHASGRL
jgi:two-component system chemotaxis response regulator CheY